MAAKDGSMATRVRALADPAAASLGVEVLDVQVTGPKGRRLVRVTADLADLEAADGMDIDTITSLTRALNAALDEHDPIVGGYTLEVTSPGADQPLRRARDFARNRGRDVEIEVGDDDETVTHRGEVVAVTDSEITLQLDQDTRSFPLDGITHARVVLPW